MPEGAGNEAKRSDAPSSHVRIFLSSPGDVAEERRIAEKVIQKKLAKDWLLRDRVTFEPISWDDPDAPLPMTANITPQEAVNQFGRKPSECDIVVVILWSRLGSHLDVNTFRKPNGEPYLSGTEWEYLDALNADPQPDILVYRRTQKPRIDVDDPEFEAKKAQYDAVKTFFSGFMNPDGSFARSFISYEGPDVFGDRLWNDLRGILRELLGNVDPAVGERLADLERQAGQAEAAKAALQIRVEELEQQGALKDDTIRSLNAAVDALTTKAAEPDAPPGIEAALAQLAAGDTSAAMTLFAEVMERKTEAGKAALEKGKADLHDAAEAARHLGSLAYLDDTKAALEAFRRAAELEPEDTWTWIEVARLERQAGNLANGLDAANRAERTARESGDERDESCALNERGDVLVEQGNLAQALDSYRASMAIRERLAEADAGNAGWQRDLIVSNVKLAQIAQEKASVEVATNHYVEALRIAEMLEEQGRLAPADAWMVEELRRLIAELGE